MGNYTQQYTQQTEKRFTHLLVQKLTDKTVLNRIRDDVNCYGYPQLVTTNISGNFPNILTQYIFGSQLSQILELEIDVNNGHAACDC